jgi:hypothetical protein
MLSGIPRRNVVIGLAGAALLPGSLRAQGAASPKKVGILIGQGSPAQGQWRVDAFDAGLRRHGYIHGQTAQIEYRWGGGNPEAIKRAVLLHSNRPV